jgi:Holliday junction resolvase RusA-like endonuclease
MTKEEVLDLLLQVDALKIGFASGPCVEFSIANTRLQSENTRLIPGRNGRLVSSGKYREYKRNLVEFFRMQLSAGSAAIQGPFDVVARFETYKDPQNLLKPLLDALQELGVIENDRLCRRLFFVNFRAKWGAPESVIIRVSKSQEATHVSAH